MDDGLIFPYPRRSAHDEPSGANHPSRAVLFGARSGERGVLWGSS
jgi:hypothetical protein